MILQEFEDNIKSLVPNRSGKERFLLAVSGGIDSMCMADMFYNSSLKLSFGVANVNFNLREGDCVKDQIMVREWATARGLPFHGVEFDTHNYAIEHSISTQMAARELRYEWFYSLLKDHSYDYIAIAHNLNDSAETLFLNLLRGTGIKGLAGIRKVNGAIIRPMITITRESIEEYVALNQVPYREDFTNFESHYHRNRLRNIVFPEFKKINPSFIQTISRSASYFVQAEELLNDLYLEKGGKLYYKEGDVEVINIPNLLAEKHMGYWLYRILSEKGFNSSQIESVSVAISGQPGKSFRSPSHELIIDRGVIKLYPISSDEYSEFIIDSAGEYNFNGVRFKIDFFVKGDNFNPYTEQGQLYLAADHLALPMTCRGWKSADRFKPLGMKGYKKLSDFFKDLKMDKREKERQPILLSGDEIVCLPGLRIDERYKITTSTKLVAEVVILN